MRYKNNPLNILYKEAKNLLGCIGNKEGFAEFDDLVHGVRAALYILMKKYPRRGIVYLPDVISEFNGHQDTDSAYFAFVANDFMVKAPHPHVYAPFSKFGSKRERYFVLRAMAIYESHWFLPVCVFDAAYLLV